MTYFNLRGWHSSIFQKRNISIFRGRQFSISRKWKYCNISKMTYFNLWEWHSSISRKWSISISLARQTSTSRKSKYFNITKTRYLNLLKMAHFNLPKTVRLDSSSEFPKKMFCSKQHVIQKIPSRQQISAKTGLIRYLMISLNPILVNFLVWCQTFPWSGKKHLSLLKKVVAHCVWNKC